MKKTANADLNRLSTGDFRIADKLPVWVILDDVRSQNNTGSIFRSSDAFRVDGIVLCGITATPPHREIHKTALGAEDSVKWEYEADVLRAIEKFKSMGYTVVAIEQAEKAVELQDFEAKGKKLALIFGNEVSGVSEKVMEKVDGCIEIPQFGTKHSLNIAVSAGIVLWEVFKKMEGFRLFG